MFMTEAQANKKYADAYNKGLTTTPDPDTLEPVEFKGDWEKASEAMNRNHAVIRGWDDAAKKTRAWVGRTLQDGVGDGYAVYVVVKEGKSTVRIKVCRGIGDDWVSRHWGEECSIKKVDACSFFPFSFTEKRVLPYDMKERK